MGFFGRDTTRALSTRAIALLQAGKFAEALPLCQELVALTPESAAAWSNLGWALMQNHRLDEAIAACETALTLNPNNRWAWGNKGVALSRLGRHEEALAAYDRACELDPGGLLHGRTHPYRNRLWPLLQLRRFDEVIIVADELLRYLPNDVEIWVKRGQALAGLRRYAEAEETFLFASELKSPEAALSQLAIFYAGNMRAYDKALTVVDRLFAYRPNDVSSWNLRGYVLSASGAYEKALGAFERAMACDGLSDATLGGLWNSRGDALMRLGRFQDALIALDKSAALAPGNAYSFITRGEVYSHIERESEALACYEAAHKAQPAVLLAQTNIAAALVALGPLDEAKTHLDAVLAINAEHGCAWYVIGFRETELGHYDDALAALDKSITLEPTHAAHYAAFAELLLKLDDPEHACRVIERALALDPIDARSWKIKAQALRAAGKLEEAAEAERRGAELLAEQTAQVDAYLQAQGGS